MKTSLGLVLFLVLSSAPIMGFAAPFDAIQLVGADRDASATPAAFAAIDFPYAVGDKANSFSGSANTSSTIFAYGSSEQSAEARASWNFQFQTLLPHTQYFIDWSFADLASVQSRMAAQASAEAMVHILSPGTPLADDRQLASVTTSFGEQSDTHGNAESGSLNLGYLAVGSLFDVTGSLLFSRTHIRSDPSSSAWAAAVANLSFTIRAVPEPDTLILVVAGLAIIMLMVACHRHPGKIRWGRLGMVVLQSRE
ncbi:hypothetical protein [Candidatus Methylocalor cossyra]|uniref:PEP-CTERM protein-sorting domain-containing protein n=1 Tax=Candidatus Methylocalor cossyra TaxID=3108543 RepID=A0ABM9NJR6_9GAMM